MRELRSCDFCGADAVGTFAIVPPELEPTEAEQRRVVCCGDCKDRLEGLLEPLLARARLEAGTESTGTTTTGGDTGVEDDTSETATVEQRGESAADADRDSGTVVASSDVSTQKRQRTSSPNATVSDAGDESNDGGADDDREQGSENDTGGPDNDREQGPELEGGISFERTEGEAGASSSDGGGVDEPVETANKVDSIGSDETDASASEVSDADGAAAQSPSRPPKAYGKVLRLLQNREFPMERSAVSNLAAGAYDLETYEVDAIIDHAVAEGEFTEKGGELHRA